jgi:hypothetical protein
MLLASNAAFLSCSSHLSSEVMKMCSRICQLSRQHMLVIVLLGTVAVLPAPAISGEGSDESEPDSSQLAIAGFIELNIFCDRGIAQHTMYDDEHFEITDLKEHQESTRLMTAVEDAAVYLKSLPSRPRSETQLPPEWPFQRKAIGGSEPEDMLRAHIIRFSTMGLTELFQPELRGLLDTPLEARTALMTKLRPFVDEAAPTFGYLYFAKDRKRSEILVAAGNLRRLSREFDTAIAEALNKDERERVSALIKATAPIWMRSDTLRREVRILPLGSKNLAGVQDAAD